MNELEQIVQQMLDEGQPEENINAVIAEYQKSETLARKCWMVKMDVLKTYRARTIKFFR